MHGGLVGVYVLSVFLFLSQGLLKQLLILPGSDASVIACPASMPALPDFTRTLPTDDQLPVGKRQPL